MTGGAHRGTACIGLVLATVAVLLVTSWSSWFGSAVPDVVPHDDATTGERAVADGKPPVAVRKEVADATPTATEAPSADQHALFPWNRR